MKFVTCLLAAALLLAGVGASHAAVRIADDRGGQIGSYITKFQRLRSSGQSVIIDGLCTSACTIVLGAVPHNGQRFVPTRLPTALRMLTKVMMRVSSRRKCVCMSMMNWPL